MNPKSLVGILCGLSLFSVSVAHATDVSHLIEITPPHPIQDQSFEIFVNGTSCRDSSKDSIIYIPEDTAYQIELTLDTTEPCPANHVAPRFSSLQTAQESGAGILLGLYSILYSSLDSNGVQIDTGTLDFFVDPPDNHQVYVPLDKPCRIVSTVGTQKPLNDQTIRSFRAWGSTEQLNTQRATIEGGDTLGACLPVPNLTPSSLLANVTAAAQAFKSSGNIVVYPGNSATGNLPDTLLPWINNTAPSSSLVNFSNNNIANSAIITLDTDATDQHFNVKANIFKNEAGGSKQANVVIDAIGFFYPKSNFTGLANRTDLTYIPLSTPCRIVNTRGSGQSLSDQTTRSFRAWGNSIQLNAQRDTDGSDNLGGCLPESNLTPSALVANVTAVAQFFKSKGNIIAYPHGATVPTSSLVNFKANNIANSSIIGLSPLDPNNNHFTIKANIFGNNGDEPKQVNVIVDALGFFYANSEVSGLNPRQDLSYTPLETPCRIVNTGAAKLTFNKTSRENQTFFASGTVAELSGQRDSNNTAACLPEEGLTPAAMAANVTVAAKSFKSKGNVVAYPADGILPNSSLGSVDVYLSHKNTEAKHSIPL